MAKVDYNFKSFVLESDIPSLARKLCLYDHLIDVAYDYGFTTYRNQEITIDKLYEIEESLCEQIASMLGQYFLDDPIFKESLKINCAYYKRVKRLKAKVKKMLEKPCVFLTFTFTDEFVNNKVATLRKYVQRYLKSCNAPYIANIDYGAQNGRVHFHAILQVERVDHGAWTYGALDFEKVRRFNETAIAKYICKLTNHAIKNTCKGNRVMYSRKTI